MSHVLSSQGGIVNEGVIVQVAEGGLAYLEEKESKKRFAFRFGKIRDYRGESARELRLRVGTRVHFRAHGNLIDEVELIEPALRRAHECT